LIAMRGLFSRYVQVGRVAVINYGTDYGKLCVIVDIIDHNRVLIDGPVTITGISRQPYFLKRLALTGLRINIQKGARLKTVTKAFKDHKILDKWKKSAWGEKIIARHNKDNLTDFQRFAVMIAKYKKNTVLAKNVREILRRRKKTIKKRKVIAKLKKEGKPIPKKLAKLIRPQPKKQPEEEKPEEKTTDKKKPVHHGRSFLASIRRAKKNKLLEKQADVAHERNVRNKKRKREKAKLAKAKGAEAPQDSETPKDSQAPKDKAKRQKTKKTKEASQASPKEAAEAPKKTSKATPKATSKATPKATAKAPKAKK